MAEAIDENTIRQYLLGEVSEEAKSAFEGRLMTDDDLFEMLLIVEDELMDERVTGELSAEEQERFDTYFMATPQRRERLELARALHDYADRRAVASEPVESPDSGPANEPGISPSTHTSDGVVKKFLLSAPELPAPELPAPELHQRGWPAAGWYRRLAVAAIILIALGGVWWIIKDKSDVNKGLAALHQAYREQRPVVARITGFNYAPSPAVTRGSQQENVDRVARNHADRILHDEVEAHPNVASYHALGRLYLAERKFDEAIEQFDKASAMDEKNAALHSDYGAALLEAGKADQFKNESGKAFAEFARSLDHLNRALELDDRLLEALFNRALCKEQMLLYHEAEKDWQSYLEKDPNSKWADEARQKLKALGERPAQSSLNMGQTFQTFLDAYRVRDDSRAWKLISQSRNATGSFIENKLADAYLDAVAQRRSSGAAASLKVLSYAGEVEDRQAHDLFLSDLIRFYQSATPLQCKSLLQARGLVRSGQENYYKSNFDTALKFYNAAKEIFTNAGDACEAHYLTYLMGSCYVQQSKGELGLSVLRPLVSVGEEKSYKWLLARTLYAVCNGNQYLRDFSEAISNGSRSLRLSEELDDAVGAVKTRYYVADIYRFVNNGQKALDLHVQNLAQARTLMPQPAQLWQHYASISLTFDQLNLYAAATAFQQEALELAVEAEAPRFICRSYNFLGLLLADHDDYTKAASYIEQAIAIGNSLAEERTRKEALAYSFLQLGYVYRKLKAFDQAMEHYDQAIRAYSELDSKFFDYLARKDKLLCCIEQGGCPALEQELAALLELYEQHRTKILEESLRNTFFDAEQTIYDVAIGFEYFRKGDALKAFEYSERSRGRSLQDLIRSGVTVVDHGTSPDVRPAAVSQAMGIQEIRERLPEQAQILQYAVLKNDLLIWVVSKDGFATASLEVSNGDLNQRVSNFLRLASSPSEDDSETFSREAASLYDLLVRPVEHWLDRGKQLCIVPDKILNYVPFGALVSQASGRYFVQEHHFILSPSSTIFTLCTDDARKKEVATSERLFSVGNPRFDREKFSDLADLQSAAREAKAITEYYESSCALTGAAATRQRVLSELENAEVIHLATHAVTDEWYPLRSKLLLAPDPAGAAGKDSDGVLQAYEIFNLNLARAKLVVLSACETGVEKYYGGEGLVGLSRPFIAKHIPLVVASLWPVNTDATARLMINFHRHRKQDGQTTADALREAQLDMLKETDGNNRLPYNWAAFVAIGGYARF